MTFIELMLDYRFGTEVSSKVKSISGLKGVIHSDEDLEGKYKIDGQEVMEVVQRLKIDNKKVIRKSFRYCWIKRCNGVLNGRFYLCARSIFLPMVRDIENDETDYVDLRNISSFNNGRNKLKKLLNKKSVAACAYCNGTYDSPTIPAAVQIDKKL